MVCINYEDLTSQTRQLTRQKIMHGIFIGQQVVKISFFAAKITVKLFLGLASYIPASLMCMYTSHTTLSHLIHVPFRLGIQENICLFHYSSLQIQPKINELFLFSIT